MRYHYSLVPGDEPIIMDFPVYATSTMQNGAFLILGATDPDSGADQGISAVPYATRTIGSTAGVDTIGILQDSTYESKTAGNVYATNSNGANYGKVIINPCAVYLAQYFDNANSRLTCGTSVSTDLEVTSIEDDLDGGWVVFTKDSSASNANSLRFITASGTDLTLDTAPVATASTSDYICKIYPQNHRYVSIDRTSCGIGAIANSAVTAPSTRLQILENYVQSQNISFQPLRRVTHANKNSQTDIKVYGDIVQLDHFLNNLS